MEKLQTLLNSVLHSCRKHQVSNINSDLNQASVWKFYFTLISCVCFKAECPSQIEELKIGYFKLWDIKYSSWNPGFFEFHSKYPIHFSTAKIFTMESSLEFGL